jgi:hypothetical protein
MKAIVNIGLRTVELQYSIKVKDLAPLSQDERNTHFKSWEMSQKNTKSKIICKQTLRFRDFGEWQSSLLFDGRMIDFHYDYEERKNFDSKDEWASYVFKGYEYIDGEPQLYDRNIIDKVILTF